LYYFICWYVLMSRRLYYLICRYVSYVQKFVLFDLLYWFIDSVQYLLSLGWHLSYVLGLPSCIKHEECVT